MPFVIDRADGKDDVVPGEREGGHESISGGLNVFLFRASCFPALGNWWQPEEASRVKVVLFSSSLVQTRSLPGVAGAGASAASLVLAALATYQSSQTLKGRPPPRRSRFVCSAAGDRGFSRYSVNQATAAYPG